MGKKMKTLLKHQQKTIQDLQDKIAIIEANPYANEATKIIESKFNAIGKQVVFDQVLKTWHIVIADVDGNYTSKAEWLDSYLSDIPSWLSRDLFEAIYSDQLDAAYQADLKTAKSRK